MYGTAAYNALLLLSILTVDHNSVSIVIASSAAAVSMPYAIVAAAIYEVHVSVFHRLKRDFAETRYGKLTDRLAQYCLISTGIATAALVYEIGKTQFFIFLIASVIASAVFVTLLVFIMRDFVSGKWADLTPDDKPDGDESC